MKIGGVERPYYIGTRQTAVFCELQGEGYDLQDYNTLLGEVFGNGYRAKVAADARAAAEQAASVAGQQFDAAAFPAYVPTGRKELTPGEMRDFVYSALHAGAKRERLPVDFEPDDVADWIDEADAVEVMKPVVTHLALLAQKIERQQAGNVPAPALKASRGKKSLNS